LIKTLSRVSNNRRRLRDQQGLPLPLELGPNPLFNPNFGRPPGPQADRNVNRMNDARRWRAISAAREHHDQQN